MDAARQVLMIKDYVQLSLTGVAAGESSTRAFSYFYDVAADAYWPAMLDFCGVEPAKLPPIIAPGATVGPVCLASHQTTQQRRRADASTCRSICVQVYPTRR